MIPEAFTSIGIRLDLLVLGWVTLGLLVLAALLVALDWALGLDGDAAFFGAIPAVIGAILGVVWLVSLVPYQGQYHRVYEVTGVVEKVSNVLTDASGELTSRPVVTLSTIDRPIVVRDSRILRLDGQEVTLACQITWHYRAADTYSCSIRAFSEES